MYEQAGITLVIKLAPSVRIHPRNAILALSLGWCR
jgi:hypothetical protein